MDADRQTVEDLLLGPHAGPGRLAGSVARVLLESLGDGFVYIESGAIANVNKAFCEMTGMSRADLLGATAPFPFWVAAEIEQNMVLMRRVVDAGGGQFELTLARKDGSTFPAALNANVVRDGRGPVSGFLTLVRDITEQLRRERELAASEQQFRLTVQTSPIGIALVDLDGRWLEVNDAACGMLGYSRGELLATSFQAITHPDDLASDMALLQQVVQGQRDGYQIDKRYLRGDGDYLVASLHVALVRMPDGRPSHFVSQIVDISHRVRTQEELTTLAITDPLTQLPNRRLWDQRLGELKPHVERGEPVVLGILDIDHFKIFNDTYGHPAGDEVLVQTAANWSRILADEPGETTLVRLGGEEFGVVWVGVELDDARRTATALTDAVTHDQRASCGLTRAIPGDDRRTVMARADAALYAAKRAGRHRVEVLMPG